MKQLLGFFLVVLALFSCGKDKENESVIEKDKLTLQFIPFFSNDTLRLDTTYQLSSGDRIQFSDIQFFVSTCKNDSTIFTPIQLFDYRSTGFKFATITGKSADFTKLSFDIGVPSNWNHADPSLWPNSSPLNITNAGSMYWGWNPGYIFMKIEAKADTISDGVDLYDHFVLYHIGTDDAFSSLDFPQINWSPIVNHVSKASFKFDLKTVFDNATNPINIRLENTTHSGAGEATLTEKVRANYCSSIHPL
jgi:hypothetical protein